MGFQQSAPQTPCLRTGLCLDDEFDQIHAQELRHIPCPAGESADVFGFELILSAIFTHRLPGFMCSPMGWLKSRRECGGSVAWSVHGFFSIPQ